MNHPRPNINSRKRLYSIEVAPQYQHNHPRKINRKSLINHPKSTLQQQINDYSYSDNKNAEYRFSQKHIRVESQRFTESERSAQGISIGVKKIMDPTKYKDRKQTITKSERKFNKENSYYHRKPKINKIKNKASMLTERSKRIQTIDNISCKNSMGEQEEMIKVCIDSLQSLLVDITNNKETSRKNYVKRNKKVDSQKKSLKTEQASEQRERKFDRIKKYDLSKQPIQEMECQDASGHEAANLDNLQNMEILDHNSNSHTNLLFRRYIENLRSKKKGNSIKINYQLKNKGSNQKPQPPKLVRKHRSYLNIQKQEPTIQEEPHLNDKDKSSNRKQDNNKQDSDGDHKGAQKRHKSSVQQNQKQWSDKKSSEIGLKQQQISLSSIEQANDSSFLSEWGKKAMKREANFIEGRYEQPFDCGTLKEFLKDKIVVEKQSGNRKKEKGKEKKLININGFVQKFPKGFF